MLDFEADIEKMQKTFEEYNFSSDLWNFLNIAEVDPQQVIKSQNLAKQLGDLKLVDGIWAYLPNADRILKIQKLVKKV